MARRQRRPLLLTLVALPIIGIVSAIATTYTCQSTPVILVNRSAVATDPLRIDLVGQDGRVIQTWPVALGPGDWRMLHVPTVIDGFYHQGHIRYGGRRADGAPIPEALGPGYLSAFPYNQAAIFVLDDAGASAMAVGEWVFAGPETVASPSRAWLTDQIVIVLSCWWRWLTGPVGLALAAGIAFLATFAVGRARHRRRAAQP